MPTSPSASPRNRLKSPRSDAPSSADTVVNATTVSAKYSAGPKRSATDASGGAKNVSASVASVPATNDPIAAVVSAAAPRPWRAIMWPSIAVAIDAGLARRVEQDAGRRAAVHRAVVDAAEHDERADGIEGERDRQQQRDGQRRADAGQHADGGAERDAGEAPTAGAARERVGEPVPSSLQRVDHGQSQPPSSAGRQRQTAARARRGT